MNDMSAHVNAETVPGMDYTTAKLADGAAVEAVQLRSASSAEPDPVEGAVPELEERMDALVDTGALTDEEAAQLQADWARGRRVQVAARALKLLKRAPQSSLLHNILGIIAAVKGENEIAVKHFRSATEGLPPQAAAWENLARMHVATREDAAAILCYRKLAVDFDGHPTSENLVHEGAAHLRLDNAAAALSRFTEALVQNPESTRALAHFGLALNQLSTIKTKRVFFDIATRYLTHPRLQSPGVTRLACKLSLESLRSIQTENGAINLRLIAPEAASLIAALLSNSVVTDIALEDLLIKARAAILRVACLEQRVEPPLVIAAMVEGLALHSFSNEFIWPETKIEAESVAHLENRIACAIAADTPVDAHQLYALAAYRPLNRNALIRDWVVALSQKNTVDETLTALVLEPAREAALASSIDRLTPIDDAVSVAVRAQYEESPYPRWRKFLHTSAFPYVGVIREDIAPSRVEIWPTTRAPRILIAGCGSGRHPIGAALRYKRSTVLGVDLSLTSLAYAKRQADMLGVENVAFAQADILKLDGLDARFDVIEAVGVLHHLVEPAVGLQRLVSLLRPGGFLRIGLYSAAARRSLAQWRQLIAENELKPDLAGIRALRALVKSDPALNSTGFVQNGDFFASSALRDLVFHVQEHEFSLAEISRMLDDQDLTFLGFIGLSRAVRNAYANFAPDDESQRDLEAWSLFEMQAPTTFAGMYQFWVRKPAVETNI
jgi:SAM-dependent methyltransferase/Tfp pilus assembly protein PilF